jgi:hypothetical protein
VADATYGGFKYQKNHNHVENIHDVPPLFDSPCDQQREQKMCLSRAEEPFVEMIEISSGGLMI